MTDDHTPWPWSQSLAGLRIDDGGWYRVRRILFGMVKDRCTELGIAEGQVIRSGRRDGRKVEVYLPDGGVRRLELPFAWFVEVEPEAAAPEVLVH